MGELEKKMEALVTAFEGTKKHSVSSSRSPQSSSVSNTNIALAVTDSSGAMKILDLVDQGLVDASTAYHLFDFYKDHLSQFFPLVAFSSNTAAQTIRSTQPVLFLTAVTASATILDPPLHDRLLPQIRNILANRVLYTGAPSLEIIQSLMITTIYLSRRPGPEKEGDRMFNYAIHSAALMAMDLGLGKRGGAKSQRMFHDPTEQEHVRAKSDTAELRRTWLGSYYGCSV